MEKRTTLTLNGELTIREAVGINKELVSALSHHDYIKIIIDWPENMDITFMQLLQAAQKQAMQEGKQLEIITRMGDDLVDLLGKAGLSQRQSHT